VRKNLNQVQGARQNLFLILAVILPSFSSLNVCAVSQIRADIHRMLVHLRGFSTGLSEVQCK